VIAEGDTDPGARRLRRVEPGDPLLIRRAQEAEANVRILEGHVAELRRSLREAETEQRLLTERLAQRENDLRRVRQREYAEQQLRTEAEEQGERREQELVQQLEDMRRSLLRMRGVVHELRTLLGQLRSAPSPPPPALPPVQQRPQPDREEMTKALASAVERLRARAAAPENEPVAPQPAPQRPPAAPALHKHSMSLIGRLRMARKQRHRG
jgi:chromosome segregation ATPase